MANTAGLRWGIIGTGGIARAFAKDLALLPGHSVQAVGSRDGDRAARFAMETGAARSYGSYEELVADPDLDAVYVATPHPMHVADTLLALGAGKPVLCEKPFAVSAAEAARMIALARERKLLLMEAMWTRFLPHIRQIRGILESGILGSLRMVEADHGQWFAEDPGSRLFAPGLGGGALLDLGIYPVSFAHMVLGKPDSIVARSDPAFTGVDAQTSVILRYPSGAHAVLNSTLGAATPCRAVISGTEGRLEIDRTFYAPSSFRVAMRGGAVTEYPNAYRGHGLREEAAEFARCLSLGLTESPLLPLDETLAIMETMDGIRRQIGLRYPFEAA